MIVVRGLGNNGAGGSCEVTGGRFEFMMSVMRFSFERLPFSTLSYLHFPLILILILIHPENDDASLCFKFQVNKKEQRKHADGGDVI
jgi:hypothetical protein